MKNYVIIEISYESGNKQYLKRYPIYKTESSKKAIEKRESLLCLLSKERLDLIGEFLEADEGSLKVKVYIDDAIRGYSVKPKEREKLEEIIGKKYLIERVKK